MRAVDKFEVETFEDGDTLVTFRLIGGVDEELFKTVACVLLADIGKV